MRSLDEIGQTLASLAHHDALTDDERGACEEAVGLIGRLERGGTAECGTCGDEVLTTACQCGYRDFRSGCCGCTHTDPDGVTLGCTRPKGHSGDHEAWGFLAHEPYVIWPNTSDSGVTA